MIDRSHELPLTRQAELLKLSRSGLYYRPRPVSPADLAVMRRIDELHLDYPFAGSRMLRDLLRGRGHRDRPPARRHADEADGHRGDLPPAEHLEAGAGPQDLPVSAARPGDRPAQPGLGDGHHLHPDGARLRLPGGGGRLVQPPGPGLAACRSRMEAEFCLEAVEEALARHGKPEIFNTDQGSQFTSADFTGLLLEQRHRDQHGRQGLVARQRLRRAALALGQIRGGLSARLRQRRPRRAPRSAGIWTSTTASARIRALTLGRRIAPISTTCRRSRQHEFRRRFRGVTLVGLRPPGVPPRKRHTTTATGRGSTYQARKPVQTKPATSIQAPAILSRSQ